MTVPRRLRLILRIAGAACLLAGLFPYYSHTSGLPSDAGIPLLEFPGLGTLPDRPSKTLVRVGLPFSPLFWYQRENSFSADSPAIPATGDRITFKSGETKFNGEMTSVRFSSGSSRSSGIEFLSWSAAAAALGMLLLVCSFLVRRGRPLPSPQVEIGGSGIGPSAEQSAAADGGAR